MFGPVCIFVQSMCGTGKAASILLFSQGPTRSSESPAFFAWGTHVTTHRNPARHGDALIHCDSYA
jgi:hypothetical protein